MAHTGLNSLIPAVNLDTPVSRRFCKAQAASRTSGSSNLHEINAIHQNQVDTESSNPDVLSLPLHTKSDHIFGGMPNTIPTTTTRHVLDYPIIRTSSPRTIQLATRLFKHPSKTHAGPRRNSNRLIHWISAGTVIRWVPTTLIPASHVIILPSFAPQLNSRSSKVEIVHVHEQANK